MSAAAEPTAWEPGHPSARAIAPSLIAGAVVPLAVYYLVRHRVSGDAHALMIAGIIPAAWIVVQWLRTKAVDLIGAIVLSAFVVGVIVSELLGGDAFVLKVRDVAVTVPFGVACLLSLRWSRPIMFYVGRQLSAGDDAARRTAYDALWEFDAARHVFAVVTSVWGVGLLAQASGHLLLAATLPTGPFLAASPVFAGVAYGGLFAFTGAYSRRARAATEADLAAQGLAYPSVAAEVDG